MDLMFKIKKVDANWSSKNYHMSLWREKSSLKNAHFSVTNSIGHGFRQPLGQEYFIQNFLKLPRNIDP